MIDTHASQATLVIEAGRAERHYWHDLWRYRELFFFLAWRDILVRYKQTTFGIAWALARPFLTMLIFTLVFSKLAALPSDGVPYSMLVLSALMAILGSLAGFSTGRWDVAGLAGGFFGICSVVFAWQLRRANDQ